MILHTSTKQYDLDKKILTLKVLKAPWSLRGFILFIAFLTIGLPISGMIFSIVSGNGLDIKMVLAVLFFGYLAFRLLRIFLWNTYGKETILFNKGNLLYEADYGWFKDAEKHFEYENLDFDTKPVLNKDGMGNLVIKTEKEVCTSVVAIPIPELKKLIAELENMQSIVE